MSTCLFAMDAGEWRCVRMPVTQASDEIGDAVSSDSCAYVCVPAQIVRFAAHVRRAVSAGEVQAGVLYRPSDKGK